MSDPASDTRPPLTIADGELPRMVDELDYLLATAGAEVYQRGGQLVTVTRDGRGGDDRIDRAPGAPRIIALSAIAAQDLATRHVACQRYDRRMEDYRVVDVPRYLAAALVERGTWRHLPELVGYVDAPTMRPEGTALTDPGYDPSTGLLLLEDAPAVDLPAAVQSRSSARSPDVRRAIDGRQADGARPAAEAALARLRRMFASLPWAEPADEAAALAALLGALYARALDAVPLAGITAPTPGTGKSLLSDAIAIIATGRRAAVMSIGRDPNEADKRLASALLAGDAVVALDNVERPLDGDMLCQAITQDTLAVRPLGGSTVVRLPARVALLATGNNLVIRGDLNRRALIVRLDAQMEHPEQRDFGGDLLADVAAQRGQLITDALTVSRAYEMAGCPDVPDLPAHGGFSDWDRLVRRPLAWLGLPDPLAPAMARRDDDPDRAAMVALYRSWWDTYGNRAVTAAEVIDDASRSVPRMDGTGAQHDYPALDEAISLVLGERRTARSLGYALRRYRGRIAEGLRLDHAGAGDRSKAAAWRVVQVS